MKDRHIHLTLVEPHAKAGKNWTQPPKVPRRVPDGYDVVTFVCIVACAVMAAIFIAEKLA